jgi:hypothetical protein
MPTEPPFQIDPELMRQFAQYLPSAYHGNVGSQGGPSGSGGDNSLGWLLGDPVGVGMLSGLFGGGDDNEWQPYIDPETGQYVFTDPNRRNAVPVANVPGAPLEPSGAYKKQASQIQAVTDLLPYLSQAVSGQILPNAQADLLAKQLTSPGLAKLMTELYGTYGTQLNDIGNQISRTNALAQVGTDSQALSQARQTLLPQAKAAAEEYDPEFFKTRELAANRLKDLFNDIDLGSGLSDVERREIEQGLAQEGSRRGTASAPSNLDTVSNAMQYGEAGFKRKQVNRSALSTAIANASAALPTFRSGVDVFQVATGKSSSPNTGNAQFTGVNNTNNAANQALGLASGMGNAMTQTQLSQMNIDANKKDWADYLNQVTSSIGDIAGVAGGIACWIARRVYGEDNPKWVEFRYWMIFDAPKHFRDWYIANGERISKLITDVQAIKIRSVMDMILESQHIN